MNEVWNMFAHKLVSSSVTFFAWRISCCDAMTRRLYIYSDALGITTLSFFTLLKNCFSYQWQHVFVLFALEAAMLWSGGIRLHDVSLNSQRTQFPTNRSPPLQTPFESKEFNAIMRFRMPRCPDVARFDFRRKLCALLVSGPDTQFTIRLGIDACPKQNFQKSQ